MHRTRFQKEKRQKEKEINRLGAASCGYDAQWAAAAAEFKRTHPWCLGCAAIGLKTKTEVVDHIEPHRGNRSKFVDPTNRQPACKWHHNAIKPILEREWERGTIQIDALRLDSREAVRLTKAKRQPMIGADGWPR